MWPGQAHRRHGQWLDRTDNGALAVGVPLPVFQGACVGTWVYLGMQHSAFLWHLAALSSLGLLGSIFKARSLSVSIFFQLSLKPLTLPCHPARHLGVPPRSWQTPMAFYKDHFQAHLPQALYSLCTNKLDLKLAWDTAQAEEVLSYLTAQDSGFYPWLSINKAWWCRPIIPAFGKWRQGAQKVKITLDNNSKFEAS